MDVTLDEARLLLARASVDVPGGRRPGPRSSEFIGATWAEVDWERAQWLIPAEQMKAGKSHTVYLAEQALDILTTLRTCFPSSRFIHPSRYDSSELISQATLNRTIAAAGRSDQRGSNTGSGAVSAGLRSRPTSNVLVSA